MNNLDKKQKIIISLLAIFIVIAMCYYTYTKENEYIEITNENIEVSNTDKQIGNNVIESKTEEKSKIKVHIAGAVNNPGVVEIEEKSRISDAINMANGLKEDANTDSINLAFILEDGMKIYIPSINDKEENNANSMEIKNGQTSEYITGNDNQSIKINQDNVKVNINTATQTELETLPGIGPSIALKIINYRKENGKFMNIEDIKNVEGIGEAKFSNIRSLIVI